MKQKYRDFQDYITHQNSTFSDESILKLYTDVHTLELETEEVACPGYTEEYIASLEQQIKTADFGGILLYGIQVSSGSTTVGVYLIAQKEHSGNGHIWRIVRYFNPLHAIKELRNEYIQRNGLNEG